MHLVPPDRTVTEDDPAPGPWGPLETLPAVTCIGRFESTPVKLAHSPAEYRSCLVIAWMQPRPTPLPAPAISDSLHDLPWDTFAYDEEL